MQNKKIIFILKKMLIEFIYLINYLFFVIKAQNTNFIENFKQNQFSQNTNEEKSKEFYNLSLPYRKALFSLFKMLNEEQRLDLALIVRDSKEFSRSKMREQMNEWIFKQNDSIKVNFILIFLLNRQILKGKILK